MFSLFVPAVRASGGRWASRASRYRAAGARPFAAVIVAHSLMCFLPGTGAGGLSRLCGAWAPPYPGSPGPRADCLRLHLSRLPGLFRPRVMTSMCSADSRWAAAMRRGALLVCGVIEIVRERGALLGLDVVAGGTLPTSEASALLVVAEERGLIPDTMG